MVTTLAIDYDARMKRSLILLLLAGIGAAQDLHFAADRPFDLLHLRLDGEVDLKAKTFTAQATLDMRALRPTSVIKLDQVGLEILMVSVLRGESRQAQAATTTLDDTSLSIALPQAVGRGERVRVKIRYRVHDPRLGLAFMAPTVAEPDVPYQVWSQGETLATRYWIPIFDNPNERMTSELIIKVPEGNQVLSNGRLVSSGKNVWHWKQEKDHVPYLLTMVVGKFAITKDTWRGKPVEYWVPPDRKDDTMRSFENTKKMLDFFSDKIGVEYPWSKYAQIVVEQFRHGGMENTSATTLTERTLRDAKAHIDTSSDGLVAHELAHQWFGDLLTCRDWAHTWLNEGFATYFEALWAEENLGHDEFLNNMRGKAGSAIRGGKKLPIVHKAYTGPWQQFDSRAYPKGAWVLHMIRRRLGDEMWWKSIKHYTTKHAHRSVETVDLRKAIEETTGESFERFFFDWTERPGNPIVEVSHTWDPKTKMMAVRIRQTQKTAAFHFPLRIEYQMADGKRFGITEHVTQKDARLHLVMAGNPSLIRIDPEFAVLMELTERKSRGYWANQMISDPSPIARIRAAEHFGKSRKDADRRLLAKALSTEKFWAVQSEIAKALGKTGGDVSRDVLLQALSVENAKARRAVVDALARFRNDETVTSALEGIVANGDASYRVEAAAISSWASRRPPNAIARLTPLLKKSSHNNQVANAALKGIGDQLDARATDLLIDWTKRGKLRSSRRTALAALGRMARAAIWDKQTSARVAGVIASYLNKHENRRIKTASIQALRDLGSSGEIAIEALEALSEHDVNNRVRKEAKNAIDKIRAGATPRLELQRLREELRKLRDTDRKMRERMEKIERKHPVLVEGG